tara:strand:- start:2238 stop:3437 length:1200 start_codon:yes stop_codon:yes gene_type:complete
MHIYSPKFYIEINKTELKFIVVSNNKEESKFDIIFNNTVMLKGISNYQIVDYDLIFNLLKENIYKAEQQLKLVFKEVFIVIDNFNFSIINYTGFKKLNGSQLLKENITYLLNSLKLKVNETENDKSIVHIFNIRYQLDNKEVENLPIGLFGNFYCHELSFFLINSNDLKNIKNILNRCNLRVKKIISKNFLEGTKIINDNPNLASFFKIEINIYNSKILYFENSALKFSQDFEFGSDIIYKDLSKITGFKYENVKKILSKTNFSNENLKDQYVEKNFFENQNFRKVSKKTLLDIANARVQEMLEIIFLDNINLLKFLDKNHKIFINLSDDLCKNSFSKLFEQFFLIRKKISPNFLDKKTCESFYLNASNIVQYGWKKEAVPIIQEKKSIFAKIFELISR